MTKKENKQIEKLSVNEGYLIDWYITSVDGNPPIWTKEHIRELFKDFYLIPKNDTDSKIKPFFNVGDWIVNNEDKSIGQINHILYCKEDANLYGYNHTNGYFANVFEKDYHLWTIEDAKPGDVLMCESGWTCIFKDLDLFNEMFSSYCFMTPCLDFMPLSSECHTLDSRINGKLTPATEQQRNLFFKKMKKAGYQWDADKKELHKIQPHYDIKNFKPFDKVLIRVGNNSKWTCDFFSYYHNGCFHCVGTDDWSQCIPFEGNETLLGTTDMCNERFINW